MNAVTIFVTLLVTILNSQQAFGAEQVELNAAFSRGQHIVFIEGCQMVIESKGVEGQPQNVESKGLPCSPDAAWTDGDDTIILKGDKIWRWRSNDEVVGPCPFSETYSLTAWKLKPNPSVKERVCPGGWALHCQSNNCYQKFKDAKNFEESVQDCKSKGGHIASIRSEGQQKVVGSLVAHEGGAFFIGVNDKAVEGQYRWYADNSRVRYSHWNKGEPNNYHGQEDCSEIYGGRQTWNDISCGSRNPRICERHISVKA